MITLTLSNEMVVTIGQVLEGAPYRIAAPILAEMQKQISEQQNPSMPVATNGKTEHVPAG